jgi:hypothetical protein
MQPIAEEGDVPPNRRIFFLVLNSRSPPSWGYESTRDGGPSGWLMSPSQQSIPTTNSSQPALFPTTCTTRGMESPIISHSPSCLSTPLYGFKHSLDKKISHLGPQEFYNYNMNSPNSKIHASLDEFRRERYSLSLGLFNH